MEFGLKQLFAEHLVVTKWDPITNIYKSMKNSLGLAQIYLKWRKYRRSTSLHFPDQ